MHPLAVRILSLLILVAGLRTLPARVVAANALPESSAQAPATPQGSTSLAPVPEGAPTSSLTHASTAKTAQQWMAEGYQAQKAGKQIEAVTDFLNAQRLDPASPDPLYSLGMSFFSIGFYGSDPNYYERAARHFKSALDLDSQYDRAVFMLAVLAVLHLQLKDAESLIQKAISLNPQNPYYHLHYGILLERVGQYDDAVAQMLLAEKLGPTFAQSYLSVGQLYVRRRKYQQARGQLERAVHLDPNLAAAHYALGGLYHHLGMNAESKSEYETFQRQKSAHPKPDPVVNAMQGNSPADSK
ncbi:MAG: tetratricopeptide repeat protein [Terriglobia bacterium]|jgi:tetratricopeptide (TPR) repeat protein